MRMRPAHGDGDTAPVTKDAKILTAIALTTMALLTFASYWVDSSGGATVPRTVLVADSAKPLPRLPAVMARDCLARPRACANGSNGIVLSYSLKGRAPRTPMLALVLTDVNCDPDRDGISHCLNELRLLGNGRRITVRHDHNMHMYPCLTPGERVRVLALDSVR
jgi:hypothetical protein